MNKNNLICILIVIFIFPQINYSQNAPELNKNHPEARMYHSLVYYDKTDCLVLFPGFTQHGWSKDLITNDLWIFDLNEDKWESHEVNNGPLKPLAYPSMTYVDKTQDILIFGGGNLESPFVGKATNDLWSFNLDSNKWKEFALMVRPPLLANQSLAYDKVNHRIILFGGELDNLYSNKVSPETWIFNLSEKKWRNIK